MYASFLLDKSSASKNKSPDPDVIEEGKNMLLGILLR